MWRGQSEESTTFVVFHLSRLVLVPSLRVLSISYFFFQEERLQSADFDLGLLNKHQDE